MELLHASRLVRQITALLRASAHVEFHFRYRAEQDELPTRYWKHKVSIEKTHFLLLAMSAVTKSPVTTMLFSELRGRMNGTFKMGKLALCHQSPISRLPSSISTC